MLALLDRWARPHEVRRDVRDESLGLLNEFIARTAVAEAVVELEAQRSIVILGVLVGAIFMCLT